MAIETVNPATGEIVRRYDEMDRSAVEGKLAAAVAAFEGWRETGFGHRAGLMREAARLLREGARSHGELITLEMGKPITESLAEVEKCAAVCDYYAERAERFLAPRKVESDARASYVRCDPIGPVLAVMPWNFPYWQVFRFLAPGLMAGNVGLLKHASNVPACALRIEELLGAAGFPEGVFTTLLISAPSTTPVIEDPRVAAVTLTGSGPAGSRVASAAGRVLKKTVLELGGSDPCIILEDADLERAADVAARSRLINTGQSCIAAKRFIAVEAVAERFASAFERRLARFVVGDPMDPETHVGPMARRDLRDELHDQVTRSIGQGARCVMGGEMAGGPGAFYPVTLLTGVTPEMAVAREETFGPVASLIVVPDEEAAVALANSSELGLGASVWTADLERGAALARRIESGAVFVNGLVKSDPRLPFGGVKQSGYGRELGEEGIREFVNVKSVWIGS